MLILSPLLASVVVAVVGVVILWSNPARRVNRVAFSCSLNLMIWLLFLHLATSTREGVQWLRIACALGGLVPLHFWLVKESIANVSETWMRDVFRRSWPWFLITCFLLVVPFTEVFIPAHSTSKTRIFGWGYYSYIIVDLMLYVVLMLDTFRALKGMVGGRRLELQVWLVGGCAMTTLILTTMALNAITHERVYIQLQPPIMLVFYAGTVIAITTRRVFDARQISLVIIEKAILVFLVAAAAYAVEYGVQFVFPPPLDLVVTTAIVLWIAVILMEKLDGLFRFYPQATSARQAAFSASQRERRIEDLDRAFCGILKGWGQTDKAMILVKTGDTFTMPGRDHSDPMLVEEAMREMGWATPERLARERATPGGSAVAQFMSEHEIGVLVFSQGPALSTLVGVGVAASRRPYTYPQVTQLMELASIMESALERAHFSAKVQHAEQLATVGLLGASLAHEIRNPLVSIKTFVQLLPTHHHDPKFRDKFFKLIGDEVGRIDQLTEQLLDLASPRTYEAKLVELHPLLRSSLDLVAAKAAHRNVEFLTEFGASPDAAFTDASAAKQVMLNLCFNAIQAVEEFRGEQRWVKIATRNTPGGIEMMVADSGPGISAEMRPKLFQPFQTTKSTGFGLGLAICSDILSHLHASISVDPPLAGQGATFRVTFPCQPLSS